jgi:DNA polymerase-4
VERISIDEAFADVAGSVRLLGPPAQIAVAIRRRVRQELGLPVSVGVARTKHLAKIASQVAKPDGLLVVQPERELEFLHPLPVGLMWGVGPVTRARLARAGICTIGELTALPGGLLGRLLGQAAGDKLESLAVNADPRRILTARRAASVGAQSAFGPRPPTRRLLRSTLGYLVDRVASRLRQADRAGRTVTVRVRFAGLRSVTRSMTLPAAVSNTAQLTELACQLAQVALTDHPDEREISLLAVSVSHLVDQPALQLELPLDLDDVRHRPGTPAGAAHWALDRSMDAIRARFGRDAVGYAAVLFSEVGRVPEEFRELAERPPGRSGSSR